MSKLKKALEKAKETRGSESQSFFGDIKKGQKQFSPKAKEDNLCRPEIDIRYSETKVKKIDESRLKEGKVISLFHDIKKIDEIKTMCTQVLNNLSEVGGNSILITSANPHEGKTFK